MRKERSDKGKKRGPYKPRKSDFIQPWEDADQLLIDAFFEDIEDELSVDEIFEFWRDIHGELGPEDLL